MGRWFERFAWVVTGAALGFAVGAWPLVDIEPTVNASDLLGVLATVVLTVLVAILGQKRFSEDRAEKDLLLSAVRDATAAVRGVRSVLDTAYQRGVNDLEATNRTLDELGSALDELRKLLNEAGHARAYEEADDLYRVLFIAFRRSVSGGEFPAAPYRTEVYYQARNESEEIVRRLRHLVFVVNRR